MNQNDASSAALKEQASAFEVGRAQGSKADSSAISCPYGTALHEFTMRMAWLDGFSEGRTGRLAARKRS
jgi:ribosome modulation factor